MKTMFLAFFAFVALAASAQTPSAKKHYVEVFGPGTSYCQAFVKASDENVDRFNAEKTPGTFQEFTYAGSVVPYVLYLEGAIQGYQQGTRRMLIAKHDKLIFAAVNFCREHPELEFSDGVEKALFDVSQDTP